MLRKICSAAVVAALSAMATSSYAGLIQSSTPAPAGTQWPSGAAVVMTTTNDPTASPQTGQFISPGTALDQTITPGSNITLDHINFLTSGMGGATGTFGIYAIPSFGGGGEGDGFVNTSFSTNLLGGGAGLPFSVNGSSGTPPTMQTFSLTGADQITLQAGTKYAIEFNVSGGTSFNLLRTTDSEFPLGNIYQGASENNFNGTPPANGRGERDAVGATQNRDALMAIYATTPAPEPASLALIGVTAAGLLGRRRRKA